MPVMNGYEMCQRIKETESTRGIPILILSARGAGVDDFLTKTVADNELLSRIEMTLDSALASQREKSSSSKTAACNTRLSPGAWRSRALKLFRVRMAKKGLSWRSKTYQT